MDTNISSTETLSHTNQMDTNVNIIFLLDVVITGFLCLFGLLGNILCLVILCTERRKNSNVYLLSALVVFDWFMLLFMLNGVALPGLCKHIHSCSAYITFLQHTIKVVWATGCIVQTATIWMVVAVTFDRFIAVCLPLQTRKTSSSRRAKQLILSVIAFSILFNLPRYFHYYQIGEVPIGNDTAGMDKNSGKTTEKPLSQPLINGIRYRNGIASWPSNNNISEPKQTLPTVGSNTDLISLAQKRNASQDDDIFVVPYHSQGTMSSTETVPTIETKPYLLYDNRWYHFIYYITLSWFVLYVIPIISLVVLNIILLRQIRSAQRKRAKLRNKQVINMQSENISVTINIIAIVTVFVMCQTPDFVHILISYPALGVNKAFLRYLRSVCYCFLALNSSCNFILYCLFFKRFRKTFLRMFCFNDRLLRKKSKYETQMNSNSDNGECCSTPRHSFTKVTHIGNTCF